MSETFGSSISPEDLHLIMLRFESEHGSADGCYDSTADIGVPLNEPPTDGYVKYEMTDEGLVTTFASGQDPVSDH